MKKLITLAAAVGLASMQACAAQTDVDETSTTAENALTAPTVAINAWGGGYVANVTLTNPLAETTSHWTVIIDLNGTTITGSWNVAFSGTTGVVVGKPMSYNTNLAPNSTVSFGWQANSPNNTKPIIKAWNMDTGNYATCDTNSGTMPTLAAMAVAAGKELGRFNVEADLEVVNGMVQVKSTAPCTGGCKNLKAILAQQSDSVQQFYPNQQIFNATNFRSTIVASVDRQKNQTINTAGLATLMANHKLTLKQGPVDLHLTNACGPHYVFQVDYKSTNLPLSSADASKLANALCFFNAAGCGGNKYIGYVTVDPDGSNPGLALPGCPNGKTCIAIDPGEGDNGSTNTTSAGSAPTYTQNRLYWQNADANVATTTYNAYLNTGCITTTGYYGSMQDKCALAAATCGYLYCVKQ